MSSSLKVRKVGNSLGVILSKDVADTLGVAEGDQLYAVRTPEGIKLTPYDPDFVKVVESNRDYMKRHRNALNELSKR